MVIWKDEYKIGVDFIDEQHKKLFDIAQKAYELLQNEFALDKYDDIVDLISELKDYTVFHFNAEEEYMVKIGYKKLFSQKFEHEDFIKKFNEVDFEHLDENQDQYIKEIIDFVLEWITKHILEKDILIAQFVSGNE